MPLLLVLAATLTIIGCTTMPGEDTVITTPDQVQDGLFFAPQTNPETGASDAALVEIATLPEDMQSALRLYFGEELTSVVVTQSAYLKKDFEAKKVFFTNPIAVVNPETGETGFSLGQFIGQLVGPASVAFPQAAPAIGLGAYVIGLLGRKRSRQHLATAGSKINPMNNGTIDLKGSLDALAKAVGYSHSTEDPEELEKIAKKKKAVAHAKNGGAEAMAAAFDAEKEKEKVEQA